MIIITLQIVFRIFVILFFFLIFMIPMSKDERSLILGCRALHLQILAAKESSLSHENSPSKTIFYRKYFDGTRSSKDEETMRNESKLSFNEELRVYVIQPLTCI